jgi:hypothetical protein
MPVPVFLSYSHRDEPWKNELKLALSSLCRYGHIEIWDDRKILAGTAWEPDIERHLARSQIFLLLVTPGYSASEYCRKEFELATASSHRHVIPLWVKNVHLADNDPIRRYQGLPRDMKWADGWPVDKQNEQHVLIADGIVEVLGSQSRSPAAAAAISSSEGVEPYFVNRETQEREFKDFWDAASWSRPGAAQVYLLPAMDADLPNYFVRRLQHDTVARLARSLRGPAKGAVDSVSIDRDLRYTRFDELQRDMARDVFEAFEAPWKPDMLQAKALATCEKLRLPAFMLVEQTVRADRAGPLLNRLLKWYVEEFWAGLQSDAHVVVFVHLVYPAPASKWERLAPWRPAHDKQLHSCLQQLFPEGRANLLPDAGGAPVKVLPELPPIAADDVKSWLRRFTDLTPDQIHREASELCKRVRSESGDTRLMHFCSKLQKFKHEYQRAQQRR